MTGQHFDLTRQAIDALTRNELVGAASPAEAYVTGYETGWRAVIDFAIRVETRFNREDLTDEAEG